MKKVNVYVMTKFAPFGKEEFVDVKGSEKDALKAFREMFPHMRGSVKENNLESDANHTYLLGIKMKEVEVK